MYLYEKAVFGGTTTLAAHVGYALEFIDTYQHKSAIYHGPSTSVRILTADAGAQLPS